MVLHGNEMEMRRGVHNGGVLGEGVKWEVDS